MKKEVQLRLRGRILTDHVPDILARLESLEHLSNQHDILVRTLGDIMEELKKQER